MSLAARDVALRRRRPGAIARLGVAAIAGGVALAAHGCKDGAPRPSGDPPGDPSGQAPGAARGAASGQDPGLAADPGSDPRPDGPGSEPLPADERARIPGAIAFVSERGPSKDVWLVRPTGEETRLSRDDADEFPAAATPDGRALIVVASRQDGDIHHEQLRLVPVDGGAARALGGWSGRARNPAIAPDGTWIVAESDAARFSDLVRVPVAQAAGAPKPLATAAEGNFEPSVSPDGARIAFVSSRDGDPEIYVMNAGGGGVRRLTAFHREDWGPRWSPDGRWIAFLSSREGRARVFVIRPDGRHTRAVSGTADVGEEREPAWSPDGRHVAFVGRRDDGTTRIWRVPADGGEPVALTDGRHPSDQPAWSPDGRYLAYVSQRDGDAELYVMRADGTGHTRLTRSPGADWLPRWVPAPAPAPSAEAPDTPDAPEAPEREAGKRKAAP